MTNDIGPGISITAFDAASVRGGVVSLNTSTGTLAYTPPVGYEGIDQFTYTITNAAGSHGDGDDDHLRHVVVHRRQRERVHDDRGELRPPVEPVLDARRLQRGRWRCDHQRERRRRS
jgi:hypothetical protein